MKQPGARRAVSRETRDAIVAAYAAGASLTEVARQFGTSRSAVHKFVQAADVGLRGRGGSGLPAEKRDAIVAAYAGGASMVDVARQFGVGPATVSKYVKAAGVTVRWEKSHRRISPERAAAMVGAYADGLASAEVAHQFGVDPATVLRYVRASGVATRRGARHAVSAEHRDAIVAAYAAGASLTEVARQFGVSKMTVSNYVRAAGVATRVTGPRHTVSDEEADAMVAAYVAGGSLNRVAEQFGVARMTVLRRVVGAGVPLRQGGAPRKCTPEQVDAIVAAYRAGTSSTEVAQRFGVREATVLRYVLMAGVPTRDQGAPCQVTPDRHEAMVAAYVAGATLREVGVRFGVSHETVREHVEAAGVSLRNRGRRS